MQEQHTNIQSNNESDALPKDITQHNPFSLCFDISSDLANITHLRRTSRCLLESMGLSRENTDDVETLIGELSTNVVRHARMEDNTYTVLLEFYEDRVIVTVADQGVGFVEDTVLPPGTLRSDTLLNNQEERFGGMGLPLIHAIADHVEIQPNIPHGTTVRAEKTIT